MPYQRSQWGQKIANIIYFLAWRKNISVPCRRRFGDPSLQREQSPRNFWGLELNFDLLLFRTVSSSTLVSFLKVSHDVEVCDSGRTNIEKVLKVFEGFSLWWGFSWCWGLRFWGNQYGEVSHELSHLPRTQLPTLKGAATEIEKYNQHRLCIALEISIFWGFRWRILCSAWNSKEMETLLGVRSLSLKLFALRRLLRIVGQQDWTFLETRLKKVLTSCLTFLPNQREWKTNHQAIRSQATRCWNGVSQVRRSRFQEQPDQNGEKRWPCFK